MMAEDLRRHLEADGKASLEATVCCRLAGVKEVGGCRLAGVNEVGGCRLAGVNEVGEDLIYICDYM